MYPYRRLTGLVFVPALFIITCIQTTPARAAITATGDVTPTYNGTDDPWDNGELWVGDDSTGTMLIDAGSVVTSVLGGIGNNTGSIGVATITGPGSLWDNGNTFFVGRSGSGTLRVTDQAVFNSGQSITVARLAPGTIELDNGVINTDSLVASAADLVGTGTINVRSLVGDYDIVFDANHGLQQQIVLNSLPGQNITINLDASFEGVFVSSLKYDGAGYKGAGSITITDDMDITAAGTAYFGYLSGSTGNLTVAGPGSTWFSNWTTSFGYFGDAEINVLDGGSITTYAVGVGVVTGSSGAVTVSGAGSNWKAYREVTIGGNGNGSVTVEDGAFMDCNVQVIVADRPGSTGSLLISGQGSKLLIRSSFESLKVGEGGEGTVTVENGGMLFAGETRIYENGSMTVTGAGSKFQQAPNTGASIQGTLDVLDGGFFETDRTGISGSVTVDGPGSHWLEQDYVTVDSVLTVRNSGRLDVANYLRLRLGSVVNIESGGTVAVASDDLLTTTGQASTLNLAGGTLDLLGSNISGINGVSDFNFTDGLLKHVASINIDLEQQGGTFAPGGSIGQTDILGDYDLLGGTLEIEFGGVGNPIDTIDVTGDIDIATLGTTLDLNMIGDMEPGAYTFLQTTGGTLTGVFDMVDTQDVAHPFISVLYDDTSVSILLAELIANPDPSGDGFVGIADLNIVLENWNQIVTPGDVLSGDLDADGYVGINDLNTVLGSWNLTLPAHNTPTPIPEPGVWAVMLLGSIALSAKQRV